MTESDAATDRVVVTGLGAVSPVGEGVGAYWSALLAGDSGIGPVSGFDTGDHRVDIGAEIDDFDPSPYYDNRTPDDYGRMVQLATASARMALEDAGTVDPDDRGALLLGTTMGEIQNLEQYVRDWVNGSFDRIPDEELLDFPDCFLADQVNDELDLPVRRRVLPTACAAGNYAIGHGLDLLRSGEVDWVLAGGADAFSEVAFTGFGRMLSLDPETSRPFDEDRRGIVVGEGSGMVFLETERRAEQRSADPYCRLLGYGLSCDANHMTIPDGEGARRVVEDALEHSGVDPAGVDFVSAHGTGTPKNDVTESTAIDALLSPDVPVNSIKSSLGHTMGAASVLEAVQCVKTIESGRIPPTVHLDNQDPECTVNVVTDEPLEQPVTVALNNSFAFGGNNCSTVFGTLDGTGEQAP